jgi:hypothetical protein
VAGCAEATGRSIMACYCRYRYKGYIGPRRLSTEEKIEFAKQIRSTMLMYDISQRILAEEYGCGAEYLCGILAKEGKKSLTTETADKIRDSLDRCIRKAVMTGCSRRRSKMEMAAE